MKNILKIPSKMVIKISTLVTIIVALLINRHRLLFLQYLMAFIHEIFHCIGAFIFKLNVNSVVFLPFGFYANIDNLYNVKWYQELIIIILGPLSFFISGVFLKYLYINETISLLLYNEANQTNFFILFFNLLPIYPLDGYRIVKLIMELFFVEKKSLRITNGISLISSFILLFTIISTNQIFIVSFIIFNQYILLKSFKRMYRDFLVSKTNINNQKTKMHFLEDLYRPFNNVIIKNKKIYTDRDFSLYLLKKKEKN